MRKLNTLRPWIPVRDTLLHWVVIVACLATVARWPNLGIIAAAFIIIGVNVYGLYIIGHDGLHRRLFNSVRANDLWNDLLVIGPIGAITRVNRTNHMTHHRVTCLSDDPDRYKYIHDGKEPVLPFVAFLTGLPSLMPSVIHVFLPSHAESKTVDDDPEPRERYSVRDLLILLAWQSALIGGLTYFIGWWAYPVLWLGPNYVFAYRGDLLRVFCEHSMMVDDPSADQSMRLISYKTSWFEQLLFAPHNMNYHMPHHLWPGIPYYNLPSADALIRQSGHVRGGEPRLIWRSSYINYLISYFIWRLRSDRRSSQTAAP
jgi:fatty acid desaturase